MSENNSNNDYVPRMYTEHKMDFMFELRATSKGNEKDMEIHRQENLQLDANMLINSQQQNYTNLDHSKQEAPNDRITENQSDLGENNFEFSKEQIIDGILQNEIVDKSQQHFNNIDNQPDFDPNISLEELIKGDKINGVKINKRISDIKLAKIKRNIRKHISTRQNLLIHKSKKPDFQKSKRAQYISKSIDDIIMNKSNNTNIIDDNNNNNNNNDANVNITAEINNEVVSQQFSKKHNNHKKKNSYKSYTDLISTLQYLNKFDWLEQNSVNSKFLPGRNLSPIIIWFMICNEYFPRAPYITYTSDEIIELKKEKIKLLSYPIQQRMTKATIKSETIQKLQLNEDEEIKMNNLMQTLKNYLNTSRKEDTESYNNIGYEKKLNNITKINYTHEDDLWLLSNKIAFYDFFKPSITNSKSTIDKDDLLDIEYNKNELDSNGNIDSNNNNNNNITDEEIMKLIGKLDLQDMINFYEAELYNSINKSENEFYDLKNKINKDMEQDKILLKNNLVEINDILIDLRIKLQEEDLFLNMLEKKQSELKEQTKLQGKEITQHHYSELKTKPRVVLEDMVCQICNDGDYAEEDLIVFCARCNISVHQRCYGIPQIPNDDWICEVCKTFGPEGKYLRCPLCSKRGGAMKPTQLRADTTYFANLNPLYHEYLQSYCQTRDLSKSSKKINTMEEEDKKDDDDLIIEEGQEVNKSSTHSNSNPIEIKKELLKDPENQNDYEDNLYYDYHFLPEFTEKEVENEPKPNMVWVHMTCVMFLPELFFADKCNMTNIDGFNALLKDRFKIECLVCQKKSGAIVNCDKGQCKKAFHPECARRARYFLDVRESDTSQQVGYFIFCEKHTPLKLRRILESKEKKYKDELTKFCKSIEKYYFTYVHENKSVTGNIEYNIGDDINKRIFKRKKHLIPKEDGQYFASLVEKYRKKIPSAYTTITVEKVPILIDEKNIEKKYTYNLIDTYIPPKNFYLSTRKLTSHDEIWKQMPYKNLTPEQKYKRYKKLMKIRNKKANELQKQNKYIKKTLQIFNSARNKNHEKKLKKKKAAKIVPPPIQEVIIEEPDTNLYCLCQKLYLDGELMIGCDGCDNWYHPKCVGFKHTKEEAENMTWYCPNCEKMEKIEKKKKNQLKISPEEPKLQKKLKKQDNSSMTELTSVPPPNALEEDQLGDLIDNGNLLKDSEISKEKVEGQQQQSKNITPINDQIAIKEEANLNNKGNDQDKDNHFLLKPETNKRRSRRGRGRGRRMKKTSQ